MNLSGSKAKRITAEERDSDDQGLIGKKRGRPFNDPLVNALIDDHLGSFGAGKKFKSDQYALL